MGLLDKFQDMDFTGLNRAFGKGKHSAAHDDLDQGIRGGPQSQGIRSGGGGGFGGGWAENPLVAISIRGAQIFFLLIAFFIFIAISTFQAKNDVGPSGLSIFSILVVVVVIIHSIVLLIVPFVYERSGKLKGFNRVLSTIRVGFVVNITWTIVLLLIALINAISANVKGCKNPDNDPNAEKEGYTEKLPGFCRNKRAATAFLFFAFFTWLATLFLVFLDWQRARRDGPRIPGFNQSTAGFNRASDRDEEEAFRPPRDDEDDDELVTSRYDDARQLPMSSAGGGGAGQGPFADPRPSGTFYDRPLFSEAPPSGYGGGGAGAGGGYDSGGGGMDEYDRIRQSLSFDRPVGAGMGAGHGSTPPTLPPLGENGPPLYSERTDYR